MKTSNASRSLRLARPPNPAAWCATALAVILLTFAVVPSSAQTMVSWTRTSEGGSWNTAGNWNPGIPANSLTTNYASFNNATGVTVAVNTSQSIAGLEFGSNAGAYTLSNSSGGTKTLTIGAFGIKSSSSNNQTLSGSKLQITLGASTSFEVNGAGNLTLSQTGFSDTNMGTFDLTLGGTGPGIGTISSVLSGSGTLTKSGTSTWVLSGNNSIKFSGTTVVTSGTLRLGNTSALGNAGNAITLSGGTPSGGTLDLAVNGDVNDYNVTVDGIGIATIVGNRADAGAGVTQGLGTLSIGSQTLTIDAGSNVTSGTAAVTFGTTTLTGNSTFAINNGPSAATSLTLGALNDLGTARTLTKSGNGTLVLNAAAASLVDGTVFDVVNGTLRATNATALGSLAAVKLNTAGTLSLGASQTIGSLDGSAGSNVAIDSTYTLTIGNALTSSFGGVIGGAGGLTKAGSGTLTLSGANTYTGATTINAGTLSLSADNNLGTAPGSPTAGKLVLGGGSLFATNSFTLSSNRGGSLTTSTTSSLTAANGATLTYGGIIAGAGNLTVGTASTGTGTVTLSGANTYTGATAVNAGTLSINSIGNLSGINSAVGRPTTVGNGTIKLGSGTSTGTLRYTGAGSSTNRVIDLAGTTGGGVLDASGTGALNFTSAFTATGAGSKTLTLTGTNTGANTISGTIVDNSSTNKTALVKDGAGTWVLSGVNTFSGGVTVNSGTLVGSGTTNVGGFAALGDYSGLVSPTTVITVNSGATLAVQSTQTTGYGSTNTTQLQNLTLNGTGYDGNGALQSNGGISTWTGNISLGSDTTIANRAAAGDPNLLYIGPYVAPAPTNFALNNHTLNVTGSGDIYISSMIGNASGDTGAVNVNLSTSNSTLYFAGSQNFYTGETHVNNGTLFLRIDPASYPDAAILGSLTIGDGVGPAGSAILTSAYDNQIADTANVTINADGLLDLATYGRAETLGSIVLSGGRISTGTGTLFASDTITVNGASTSTIDGKLNLNGAPARVFDVGSGSTLQVNARINSGGFIKDGTGTLVITSNNSSDYTGLTDVTNGILSIQNANALGSSSGSSIVRSGSTLQLETTSYGNVAVGSEPLTISGAGYNNLGALNSKTGTNSWGGQVMLGGDATIRTDADTLTVTGTIAGTGASAQTLTVTGSGNTNLSAVNNSSGGNSVGLTKTGSGTLTLGVTGSFSGAIAIDAGTLAIPVNNALGAQTNAVSVASSAALALSGGNNYTNTIGSLTGSGLVSIAASTILRVNNASADTFDGRLTGAGLFEKLGAGTFTFSSTANTSAFNFAGTAQLTAGTLEFQGGSSGNALTIGTLKLTGGTLLLSNAYINVGTLNITGNTILDFGTGAASILNATDIYIAAGATLTVRNWSSEVDYLFANSDFRQNNGSGTLANFNAIGDVPQNQVHFEGDPLSPDGSHTAWTEYYPGYADHQIRPIPEPSTYGAILIAACAGFLFWKRRRAAAQTR